MKNDGQVAVIELIFGSVLFLSVGIFSIVFSLPSESGLPIRIFLSFGLAVFLIATITAALKGLILLGESVVIPRSRPSELNPPLVLSPRWNGVLSISTLIITVSAAMIIDYFKVSRSLLAFLFIIFLSICYIALGVAGFQTRKPRVWQPELFCFGGLSAIFGVWEYMLSGTSANYQWFLLWLGAASLVAGVLRLLSFLKSHTPAASCAS